MDIREGKRLVKPVPFGKYLLLERINVGGMAEVFKAKAFGVEGFERLLAVKRILANIAEDEEFITMFIDEAKIAGQLQHANIAQIFDLGKVDDAYFIALEYIHGKDLRATFDHIARAHATMAVAQACFIIMQVCEGLDYAHNKRDPQGRELNLVHRDVSPQNILVGYDGEVKIVDFGIAKAAGKASKTQAGILKGKFGYMSPEQVRGLPVDRRSDIFALGIVLYELVTAERLFIGESDFSTLEKVRNVEVLPPTQFNKKIPAELERIVLKTLAKDVEDRYQNAIDLHDDLQAFLYSIGEFYSRKDLAAWMKKTFAAEIAEEGAKLEEYVHVVQPGPNSGKAPGSVKSKIPATPIRSPMPESTSGRVRSQNPGSRPKPKPAATKNGEGLEWDEEELETQIFDKPPMDDELSVSSNDELDSGDILLAEQDDDDKTVAVPLPPELLDSAAATQPGGDQDEMPAAPLSVGPPPGISAFRQTMMQGQPVPLSTRSEGLSGVRPLANSAGLSGSAAFRKTLAGMPATMLPGVDGYRTAGELPSLSPSFRTAQKRTSRSVAAVAAVAADELPMGYSRWTWLGFTAAVVALLCVGFLGFQHMTRPGKLQVVVVPSDAEVLVDDKPMHGVTQLRSGPYQVTARREGYVAKSQVVEISAGELARIDLALDPSPDTGFELTSDPAGKLVWLDGQPFMGKNPSDPQARTNFKAYPVAPGRHLIEIRGDPRFRDWSSEFFQEPGKMMKLRAELAPAVEASAPLPDKDAGHGPPPAPVHARSPRVVRRPAVGGKRITSQVGQGHPVEECVALLGSKPWSEVTLDGKAMGHTPLVNIKIACGKHRVTFKNSDLSVEKSITLTAKPGETLKHIESLIDE